MLTPMKLLLLVLLAAAFWYGWRFWRWQSGLRKEFQRHVKEAMRQAENPRPAPAPEAEGEIDDLAACPLCGTYGVPGQVKNCGRQGCPYPG